MTIAIDADCALTYWMSKHAVATQRDQPSSETLLERIESGNIPDWAYGSDGLVHVVTTDPNHRLRRRGVSSRLAKSALPVGSFAFTQTGISVVSPECCFLRAAPFLTTPELAKLGMMLCSSFCFDEAGCMMARADSLTDAETIRRYVERVSNVDGAKQARQAARYLVDGAASPAEIDTLLLLCLPKRLGGIGCPLPEFNGHVKLHPDAARTLGYSDCYCDLLWRKEKCAVEYTSELFHTGYRKQTQDEMRRSALESSGYRVFLLMKNQLRNQVAFEGFARSVFRALGKRFPKASADCQSKQHSLRRHLLHDPSWIIERACRTSPRV